MAVNMIWCIFLCLTFVFGFQEDEYFQLVTKDDCTTKTESGQQFKQYFDTSQMKCMECSQNTAIQDVSSDGYSCVCRPGYRYSKDFGGSNIECVACATQQARSADGWRCVTCHAGTTFNNQTKTCVPCAANNVPVERTVDGTLVSTPGGSQARSCQRCNADTSPNVEGNRCERCTMLLKLNPTVSSCSCDPRNLTGGVCFPTTNDPLTINTLPLSSGSVESAYVKEHVQAAYLMCKKFENITACQILSNLCVLSWYRYDDSTGTTTTCNLYRQMLEDSQKKKYLPWLYYSQEGNRVLDDDKLTTEYTFSPASLLEYRVGRYTLNGTYLGISPVTGGLLQLCSDTTSRLNAAYTFGTYYEQTCSIPAIELWDTKIYQMEFYDLYIEFTRDGGQQLYAAPVKINNLEVNRGDTDNRGTDSQKWTLSRRFFMVDNVVSTGTDTTGGAATSTVPQYVRYAKDIEISVTLDSTLGNGRIFPPLMTITYDQVSLASAQAGATITPTFKVKYSMSLVAYLKDFQIAVGTLSTLGVIFAGYKTWAWSKRAGRLAIDFAAIVNFMFFVSGVLSNVFFVITFGIAFYFFIFYKRQSVVYLFLLEGSYYEEWLGLFGSAFALKCLQVAHMVATQCTVDIFFIDWEKPKGTLGIKADGSKKENPVSIWRTYFAANEWNEIQTCRKINHIFQIFAVVFFLNYVGFENTATKDPNGQVVKSSGDYQAPSDPMFRYAIAALVYLLVAFVQWLFFTLFYERFFEDKVRDFVDLCSMANISVFIMHQAQYGYYIHGRSVYGKADTNMKEMFEMMKKEEKDLVGQRGLLPNTEQQTFVMTLPRKLRLKYEEVLLAVALESAAGPQAGKEKGGLTEKQVEAYNVINKFLSTFIDHSLKSLDYQVRDKTLLESIMDTEFLDASEKGYFYNDNGHSFDQCLFYGNEITLLLFDTLLFCIVDLIAKNFVLAGIITYIIIEIVALIRDHGGRKNLAKKTLVDERFLI